MVEMNRALSSGVILAAAALLASACGSPDRVADPAPVPRTYLIALTEITKDDRNAVRLFEVGADGRLTATRNDDLILPLAPRPAGPFVDAKRRLVYFAGGSLIAYRLDPSNGALSFFGQVELPQSRAIVDPSGNFVYSTASGSVFGYRIDTSAGLRLEPLPGSPFTTPAAHGYPSCGRVAFSHSGRFVWVEALQSCCQYAGGYPRSTQQAILSFRVNPESGALQPTGQLDVKVYDYDRSNLAVEPGERFAFLFSRVGPSSFYGLTTFGIDTQSGALAKVASLPDFFASALHVPPPGRWLLALAGGIDTLEIQPQGELVLRHSLDLGDTPEGIVQHGPHVYASMAWHSPPAIFQGARLASLRLDEGSGALAILQDLQLPERRILSLAVALSAD